jgi:hypothetical protein
MKTVYWVIAIVIAFPIILFLFYTFLSLVVPPQKSGRQLLKKRIHAHGGDASLVPESVLNELVEKHIRTAKTMASFSGDPRHKNWRANLVKALEVDGKMIAIILAGERGIDIREFGVWQTLVRHGVIKE